MTTLTTPYTLTVRIGSVPDKRLSANARISRWTLSRVKQATRNEVQMELRQQGVQPAPSFPMYVLDLAYAWPAGRLTTDDDNAWHLAKCIRDQLAVALDINDRQITQGTLTQIRAPKGDRAGWVELTITGVG